MTREQHSETSCGFSVMELMIVLAILLILAAIEIPNLLRARITANQAAAVASLRTIETAEITYAVTYSHGYSSSLGQLGPSQGSSSPQAADLIDNLLAAGEKGGYTYVYVPGPAVDGKIDTYTLQAVPSTPCATGFMSYSMAPSDQSTISGESFTTAVEKDFIAQVLIESLGRDSVSCSQ